MSAHVKFDDGWSKDVAAVHARVVFPELSELSLFPSLGVSPPRGRPTHEGYHHDDTVRRNVTLAANDFGRAAGDQI